MIKRPYGFEAVPLAIRPIVEAALSARDPEGNPYTVVLLGKGPACIASTGEELESLARTIKGTANEPKSLNQGPIFGRPSPKLYLVRNNEHPVYLSFHNMKVRAPQALQHVGLRGVGDSFPQHSEQRAKAYAIPRPTRLTFLSLAPQANHLDLAWFIHDQRSRHLGQSPHFAAVLPCGIHEGWKILETVGYEPEAEDAEPPQA
jgi:hypothetical protein